MEPLLYAPNVEYNKKQLQNQHDVMCLALGFSAGVLGLESHAGIALYVAGSVLITFSFDVVCCGRQPKLFFVSPVREIYVNTLWSGAAGFVIMWCLSYTLVNG